VLIATVSAMMEAQCNIPQDSHLQITGICPKGQAWHLEKYTLLISFSISLTESDLTGKS
jgi:hypothetical protein